ncbi:uncharacterized protein V6R79_020265 [Siganus canaliculatus]
MEQQIELCEYSTITEPRTKTNPGDTEHLDKTIRRRLLMVGVLVLGVLCIVQATLNISLRLASDSREGTNQLHLNSLNILKACQIDLTENVSAQTLHCNNLLRELLRQHEDLKKERDRLHDLLTTAKPDDNVQESGDGSTEDDY